eukprot:TRINITY_DN7843_c0_g1_i1.p1 TRINITY_DN7843_c0_g1~~TRINITY_DN7843_c0_g1_i1.p1  ORF type:complete len:118 (-),score=34.78 TRINITY_DN7843_c0_g1_i1:347-700(-)
MPSTVNLSDADLKRIKAQFVTLDQNGDGMITIAEMRKALSAAGQDYTLKDVQKMVKKADKNGDGRVVWEEFLDMMTEHFQKETVREKSRMLTGRKQRLRSMTKQCKLSNCSTKMVME